MSLNNKVGIVFFFLQSAIVSKKKIKLQNNMICLFHSRKCQIGNIQKYTYNNVRSF